MSEKKIVFFIENISHLRFLKNIINVYLSTNNSLEIVSLEKIKLNKKIKSTVLVNNVEKLNYLKNLNADLFFTTTPGIGSSIFPKSLIFPRYKRPKYIYIFHSLVSPNEMYANNSFKNFDYIISPSLAITKQLSYLVSEKVTILDFGYPLFDNIEPFSHKKNIENSILIAPSWGEFGLSSKIDILDQEIWPENFEIKFRPHPMNISNFKDLNLNYIKLDLNLDLKLNELATYRYLITDCSGIALEYYFLTGRPSIFINTPKKIKRKISKKELKINLIEDVMKNKIGKEINIDEIKDFLQNIESEIFNVDEKFITELCIYKNVCKNIKFFNFK